MVTERTEEQLRWLITSYEQPLPTRDEDGNFTTLTDHRFNDDGICIRCGEDAEEWDAGCVEKYVVDLESICTAEFADALGRLLRAVSLTGGIGLDAQIATVEKYLEKITMFYVDIEFAKSMGGGGNVQEQNLATDSTG